MRHLIVVEPFGDGWTVRSDQVENDMPFHSGASAETAAKALAERLNRAGQGAEIHILLRDGTVAARFVCPAQSWPGAPASDLAPSTPAAGAPA